MSPESVCEVLAQNTPQIIFYSLLKLPLLGYEPKLTVSVFVPLNANELVLPDPFSEEGGALRAHALAILVLAFANKHSTISTSLLSLKETYSV